MREGKIGKDNEKKKEKELVDVLRDL